MKSLLLVRHAKSSWDSNALTDFERPLNERGNRDAPLMAARLLERKVKIDGWVSSPANRALTTAKHFAKAYGVGDKNILTIPELYHAPPSVFYSVITSRLSDDWQTAVIFSHNPGITEFVNLLGVARVDNMPTCGILGLHADIERWRDFRDGKKHFWLFDYPKLM
jgi:phosphohistidine phosphatase